MIDDDFDVLLPVFNLSCFLFLFSLLALFFFVQYLGSHSQQRQARDAMSFPGFVTCPQVVGMK